MDNDDNTPFNVWTKINKKSQTASMEAYESYMKWKRENEGKGNTAVADVEETPLDNLNLNDEGLRDDCQIVQREEDDDFVEVGNQAKEISNQSDPTDNQEDNQENPLPYLEKTMAEAIDIIKKTQNFNEVTTLNLNMCRSDNISGLTNEFIHLRDLCLNDIGLQSLTNFPPFPSLKRLSLRFNKISTGLHTLRSCHSLMFLDLAGNPFGSFESLKPLASIKTLKYLDIFNTKIYNTLQRRAEVYKLIASLHYLDMFDRNLVKVTREKIIKDLQFEPIGL